MTVCKVAQSDEGARREHTARACRWLLLATRPAARGWPRRGVVAAHQALATRTMRTRRPALKMEPTGGFAYVSRVPSIPNLYFPEIEPSACVHRIGYPSVHRPAARDARSGCKLEPRRRRTRLGLSRKEHREPRRVTTASIITACTLSSRRRAGARRARAPHVRAPVVADPMVARWRGDYY